MARRLREKQPKVVYLELCEDMAPLLTELRNCRLPVAVQAFASEIEGFPLDWAPLSVVAPVTEASAEYQAIAYALDTPGVELVLVDRSSDHVFQWETEHLTEPDAAADSDPVAPDTPQQAALHGDAVGVEIGDLRPRFAELEEHLLRHGRVRHWSEWWHQYVELPLGDSDHDTYRQVMLLIGSLFRRLAPGDPGKVRVDENRERYMWTRMREHLAATGADPADCLYVCGAFHAASRVEEFGVHGRDTFTISPPSPTKWRHGLIPSSHTAIEAQFGLAAGSVSIAASEWAKNVKRTGVRPFRLEGQAGTRKSTKKPTAKKALPAPAPAQAAPPADRLTGFLRRPPVLDRLDEAELLGWSVDIVRAARRNGYLASTADAIAVFETSILLAGMRERARPTPYDFQDAAVTCIEKDAVPGRRDVGRLVRDPDGRRPRRPGRLRRAAAAGPRRARPARPAGPEAPAARSAARPAGHRLAAGTGSTAPTCCGCCAVCCPTAPPGPIMGERRLGERPIQESWDLALGTHQRALIELGYEGVSIEQVLEQRLRRAAYAPQATAARSSRPSRTPSCIYAAAGSPTSSAPVPWRCWRANAASTARRRCCAASAGCWPTTAPPNRCCRPGSSPSSRPATRTTARCCRRRSPTTTPPSARSRPCWASCSAWRAWPCPSAATAPSSNSPLPSPTRPSPPASHCCGRRRPTWAGCRGRRCGRAAPNCSATRWSSPPTRSYLSGFVHALEPVPGLADFVVEAVSNAFARLPDPVLLPWLPTLITGLRAGGSELAPLLIREAGRVFPARLAELDSWVPPWRLPQELPRLHLESAASTGTGLALLSAHPATCDALADLLGCEGTWGTAEAPPAGAALLARHPETATALEVLLAVG